MKTIVEKVVVGVGVLLFVMALAAAIGVLGGIICLLTTDY